MYAEGAPLIVSAGNLLKDNQTGKVLAQLKLKNISVKPLKAATVLIRPLDAAGKPMEGDTQQKYLDLTTKTGEEFGQKTAATLPDASARGFSVEVTQTIFFDNSTWEGTAAYWDPLPEPEGLEKSCRDEETVKQFRIKYGKDCNFVPRQHKDLWLCACGTWNRAQYCYCCGKNKDDLISLDWDEIVKEKDNRLAKEKAELEAQKAAESEAARKKAEETRERKIKQKRLIKKISLVTLAAAFLAFLVYATGWHIIPFARYKNACKALESQSYDEAYNSFAALGTFSDSAEKATDTLYQKAVYLQNNGSYLEAAELFDGISEYKDSGERADSCRKEAAYLDAKALFESGEYQKAADAFKAISGYNDSKEQADISTYLYAQKLLESGEYEKANSVFSSIPRYKDSKSLANESLYRLAAQYFDQKKYGEACSVYKGLGSYKDSKDCAKESEYLYAIERFDAGDYEKAVSSLKNVINYKDASERLLEAKYKYAVALTEKSDWKKASSLFKELGDYQDSASRYKESYYQYGLQLIDKKTYTEAVAVFTSLGNYQDSKTKINEAKYGYVLANKNRTNTTTYSYLKDLKSAKYRDSKEIYSTLYAWKITGVINDSETNETRNMSSISKYKTVYCHLTLTGGPPDEGITLKGTARWPNGNTNTHKFSSEWYDGSTGSYYCWYNTPSRGATGKLVIKIYNNATNELLGEFSVMLTN